MWKIYSQKKKKKELFQSLKFLSFNDYKKSNKFNCLTRKLALSYSLDKYPIVATQGY